MLGLLGRRGIRLGRFFGVDVQLDVSWFFIFFILIFFAANWLGEVPTVTGTQAWVFAILGVVLFFLSLLAHEFGHAFTARAFGIKTHAITLFMFGGAAQMERGPKRPTAEFCIALAGPAVSFITGVAFGVAWYLLRNTSISPGMLNILAYLGSINLILTFFNLIPGFPLDGGMMLRAAIWGVSGSYLLASRIAGGIGRAFGGFLLFWGIAGTLTMLAGANVPVVSSAGPFTALIGWFMMGLAKAQQRHAEVSAVLGDLTVRDLMRPIHAVVPADTLISDVIKYYFGALPGDQFPVVEDQRLLGLITRAQVDAVPERQWDWVRAGEVARPFRREASVPPGLGALDALQLLAGTNITSVPVFQDRRLLGYLFRNDLLQAYESRKSQVGVS